MKKMKFCHSGDDEFEYKVRTGYHSISESCQGDMHQGSKQS